MEDISQDVSPTSGRPLIDVCFFSKRAIFGHRTSMAQLYCKYNDPSEGTDNGRGPFVYQYYNLDSTNNTYEAFFERIKRKRDLALAKRVAEENHL